VKEKLVEEKRCHCGDRENNQNKKCEIIHFYSSIGESVIVFGFLLYQDFIRIIIKAHHQFLGPMQYFFKKLLA